MMLRHVRTAFGRRTRLAREVKSHGRFKTDVCLYADGSILAIEAKLFDWRRALGQARLNTYYADRSYIALWQAQITDGIVIEASRHGVGVIGVSRSRIEVVHSNAVSQPDPVLRTRVLAAAFA
jgi:hypothetical protein